MQKVFKSIFFSQRYDFNLDNDIHRMCVWLMMKTRTNNGETLNP